jgi:outer membrane protein assembly factor BamE (lipoprotein component of BamABCDE complex)
VEGEQVPEGLGKDAEKPGRFGEREEFFDGAQWRDTMKTLGLVIVTLFLLTACATSTYISGSNIESLRSLEAGKATKADVLTLAGQPLVRVPGPDGTETWTYLRTEGKGFAVILPFYAYTEGTTQQKTATLTFRGEVLERIEWKP